MTVAAWNFTAEIEPPIGTEPARPPAIWSAVTTTPRNFPNSAVSPSEMPFAARS
jgi:hypothetical protein